MKQNKLILIAIVVIGAIFAISAMLYNQQQAEKKQQLAEQNARALTPAHAVREGNPNAKVTIVEFFDPACETCKEFHPLVKQLMAQYPDKVNLVMRYAPLHPGSDQMVAILEAARKQDQFWHVLELMFETQQYWAIDHQAHPQLFWGYLKGYGFDVERINQDMQDPSVVSNIQQDITDGELLGANMTPTFFVNGKPLATFGYEQLQQLVASEVAANY
ncbi:MAG: DsbA family protein [Gammaproteobacteria bacterium]|nr:DsbA family protein [Gammaproteobacteria bacterium]